MNWFLRLYNKSRRVCLLHNDERFPFLGRFKQDTIQRVRVIFQGNFTKKQDEVRRKYKFATQTSRTYGVYYHLTLLLAITMLSDCTIADIFDGKEQVTTIFLSSLAGYLERDRIF